MYGFFEMPKLPSDKLRGPVTRLSEPCSKDPTLPIFPVFPLG